MRLRNFFIAVAVLALAVPGVASAQRPADSGFKVTGGGQIIADSSGGGAGDTVGFVAQELDGDDRASEAPNDAARGQFQFVPRGESTNASAPQEKFHGVVTCLISGGEAQANEEAEGDEVNEALEEGMARFGGYVRERDGAVRYFTVDVQDNGQPNDEPDDMILVRFTAQPCADNPEDEDNEAEDMARLGRGNVKIHNNPDDTTSSALANAAFAAYAANAIR